jgi:hypothetical protein
MAEYIITNVREPVNFDVRDNTVLRIVQNAKNLIMTHRGEVPYDRMRGFNYDLFHLPVGDMREALLPELDRALLWEPNVHVIDATAEPDENGEMLITATIDVNTDL